MRDEPKGPHCLAVSGSVAVPVKRISLQRSGICGVAFIVFWFAVDEILIPDFSSHIIQKGI